jgi:hypothetical protein
MYRAIRKATITAAARGQFRIVHLSVQSTHVHMLVEAEDKQALGRGMQGFQISAARNINTALAVGGQRRCGKVFADRYHASVIGSPRQARNALAYVLANFRKHREDREGVASTWLVDPFSTAILFTDWQERGGKAWPIPVGYEPLMVRTARTWLLAEGWKRAGGISVLEVPSRKR